MEKLELDLGRSLAGVGFDGTLFGRLVALANLTHRQRWLIRKTLDHVTE
jgi:hypothetical protein